MIWFVSVLIIIGSLFMVISSLGIIKFPDLYMRMHATTKASSIAIGLLVFAAALYFAPELNFRATCIIIFVFLTSPIGAHLVARSAHLDNVPLWEKTHHDDYEEVTKASRPSQPVSPKKAPTSDKSGNTKISEIFKNLKDKNI